MKTVYLSSMRLLIIALTLATQATLAELNAMIDPFDQLMQAIKKPNKNLDELFASLQTISVTYDPETSADLLHYYINNIGSLLFNIRDRYNNNMLHRACYCGNVRCVQIILQLVTTIPEEKWFMISAQNGDRRSPLHCAVQKGHTEIVKAILKSFDDYAKIHRLIKMHDEYGKTVFYYARKKGYENIIQILNLYCPEQLRAKRQPK